MYDINYIAVPLDFSRASRAALALARSVRARDTTVSAVHVVEKWPAFMEQVLFPYAPLGEDAPEIERDLVEAARHALRSYHDLGDDEDGPEPELLYGPLKSTLVDYIRQSPSQLLIAGAFGEGGPMPDSLGSVAERLLLSTGRPTLLVRGLDQKPTVKKLLVALDLAEGGQRVFEVAVGLAQLTGAELEIIHVVPDPLRDDQGNVLAPILNFDRRKAASRSRDRVEALFERLFRAVQPAFADEVEVRELAHKRRVTIGDPATEIVAYAEKTGADTVVVGSQNPTRLTSHLGRVAATVARRTPTHVCVVPIPSRNRLSDDD